MMRSLLRIAEPVVELLASLKLAMVLLGLLALLTYLGTVAQVEHGLYEAQQKYFSSFFLVEQVGSIPVPLPGANLVLTVLFFNLIVGGMVRLRGAWGKKKGILLTHLGMAILLLSGFVEYHQRNEGHLTLYEGQSAAYYQSFYESELAITRRLDDGQVEEHVMPASRFEHAEQGASVVLEGGELPFRVEVTDFMANATPLPKGPMFEVDVPVVDGVFLREEALNPTAEANGPGAYVRVLHADGRVDEGILWAFDAAPLTVRSGPEQYALDLRKERYPMPFEVALDVFTKRDHPRTSMPAWFSSDVTIDDGTSPRPVTISMNEPLREAGLVLYQASWGPSTARPGDPLFSTLSVVRNPADAWPLIGCLVVAAGLLMHFSTRLWRHVAKEVRA
ncbi:MAG: cytochrome c biogenesis protein ResB [Planctomycetota bacterium]